MLKMNEKLRMSRLTLSMVLTTLMLTLAIVPIGAASNQASFVFSKAGCPSAEELQKLRYLPLQPTPPPEEWPEIPLAMTMHSSSDYSNDSMRSSNYFQKGMRTNNMSYAGFYVEIYGGDIANIGYPYTNVRLTPHIANDPDVDYIALVLEDVNTAGQLALYTYQHAPEWPDDQRQGIYVTNISKTQYYRFCVMIYDDYEYCIYYAPLGQEMQLIRSQTYTGDSISCMVWHMEEQIIPSGFACQEHGTSYWRNLSLITTAHVPVMWDNTISTSTHTWQSGGGTNILDESHSYSYPSYWLNTWSES